MKPSNREITDIIIETVLEYCGLTYKEVRAKCRRRDLADARSFIYFFMRRLTDYSFQRIGLTFFQDHASVICGVNKIEALIKYNGKKSDHDRMRQVIDQEIARLAARLDEDCEDMGHA